MGDALKSDMKAPGMEIHEDIQNVDLKGLEIYDEVSNNVLPEVLEVFPEYVINKIQEFGSRFKCLLGDTVEALVVSEEESSRTVSERVDKALKFVESKVRKSEICMQELMENVREAIHNLYVVKPPDEVYQEIFEVGKSHPEKSENSLSAPRRNNSVPGKESCKLDPKLVIEVDDLMPEDIVAMFEEEADEERQLVVIDEQREPIEDPEQSIFEVSAGVEAQDDGEDAEYNNDETSTEEDNSDAYGEECDLYTNEGREEKDVTEAIYNKDKGIYTEEELIRLIQQDLGIKCADKEDEEALRDTMVINKYISHAETEQQEDEPEFSLKFVEDDIPVESKREEYQTDNGTQHEVFEEVIIQLVPSVSVVTHIATFVQEEFKLKTHLKTVLKNLLNMKRSFLTKFRHYADRPWPRRKYNEDETIHEYKEVNEESSWSRKKYDEDELDEDNEVNECTNNLSECRNESVRKVEEFMKNRSEHDEKVAQTNTKK